MRHTDPFEEPFGASVRDFPSPSAYSFTPEMYFEHVARVRRAVGIPVIGSLNGTTGESWLTYSRLIEQAGASALELNMYEVMTSFTMSSAEVEDQLVRVTRELKHYLRIPVAVKLSPFFASLANLARRLDRAGADAIVLFNRFYQPDIDITTMTAAPCARLSTSAELLLRLRWLAILHGRVRPSLVATGGVATPEDGIKAVLAGADVVQVVSAILRHGPSYFRTLRAGLEAWMEDKGLLHIDDVRGRASLRESPDPGAFERALYIRALHSWKTAC